jgi:hypothetical protein
MKSSKLFLILAIVSFAFASCSKNNNVVEEALAAVSASEKSAGVDSLCGTCDFTGTLTDAEITSLMEMREEEKLAGEVYLAMNAKYNYRIFANIAKSEDAHENAVLYVIKGFGLTDPSPVAATEFSNPVFTELYAQLTAKGSVSLVEALKVGAFIEEYDIVDLQRHIAETENFTVAKVYGNLLKGSENHLRAFTSVLAQMGEIYSPVVISQETFDQILSENSVNGNKQNGNQYKGNSNKNQKGKKSGNN